MDFKLNILDSRVVCDKSYVEDFPDVLFGETKTKNVLFDSTHYLMQKNMDNVDWRVFSRTLKPYIEQIAKTFELNRNLLFFLNKDGHILMQKELLWLFLAFADSNIFVYFYQLIGSAIEDGIAFSDGFAVRLASSRIPAEILRQMSESNEQGVS